MPKSGRDTAFIMDREREAERVLQQAKAWAHHFGKMQAKRRMQHQIAIAKEDSRNADFRSGAPAAATSPRELNARQQQRRQLKEKLAARGKTPKQQNELDRLARKANSANELLSGVRQLQHDKHTKGVYLSAHRNYVKACELYRTASTTYTLEGLTALAFAYVVAWELQSSSLSDLLTRLKQFAQAAKREWIAPEEEAELRGVRLMLERQYPSMTIGAKALTWLELDPLLNRLLPRAEGGDVYAAQVIAMALLAHECMLRGNEYLGRSLLHEDVRIFEASATNGNGGVAIVVYMPKANKDNHDERDSLRLAVARPKEPLHCPRRAVQRYLALERLKGSDVLFPRRLEDGSIVMSKDGIQNGFSYDQFTAVLRKELAKAGVADATSFVARSFRSGGHTDFAAEGVDDRVIGMLGGWKDPKSQARYMRMAKAGFKILSQSH